jgi:hypothetical protein
MTKVLLTGASGTVGKEVLLQKKIFARYVLIKT